MNKVIPLGIVDRLPNIAAQQPSSALKDDIQGIRHELGRVIQFGGYNGEQTQKTLQYAVDAVTNGGKADISFDDQRQFDELLDIQVSTQGKHETAVGIQADEDGGVTAVNELESAQKSHGSVSYDARELNTTQATYHNHPTEGKTPHEIVLQGFSDQDIASNQRTKAQITQTQGADVAESYTHFLGKEYVIGGQSYHTVIASGLDNTDNIQRKRFNIGTKAYNHAVKCPDGQIRDVMELEPRVAAQILKDRLLAINGDEATVRVAA